MRVVAIPAALVAMCGAAWGQSLLNGADASPYDPPKPRTYRIHDGVRVRMSESVVVSAEVVDVRPNGTLVVQGRKRRKVNGREENLRLTGEVLPASVTNGVARFEDVMNAVLVVEAVPAGGPDPGFLTGVVLKAWPF